MKHPRTADSAAKQQNPALANNTDRNRTSQLTEKSIPVHHHSFTVTHLAFCSFFFFLQSFNTASCCHTSVYILFAFASRWDHVTEGGALLFLAQHCWLMVAMMTDEVCVLWDPRGKKLLSFSPCDWCNTLQTSVRTWNLLSAEALKGHSHNVWTASVWVAYS